jgi:hypothetical protein
MSDPMIPRTGMKGMPRAVARSWLSMVAQQLSRSSIVPVSAARRYAGASPKSCSKPT